MTVLKKIVLLPISIAKAIKGAIDNLMLGSYLKRFSINKIDAISGYEFETYLSYLFKSMGYKSVTTKKAHDYGADLMISRKKETIVVQAKLYYNKNVGLGAIQEAKTSMLHYGCDRAVVITNSHFTKSAITLAKTTGVALIDREMLVSLIQANKHDKTMLFSRYMVI